MNPRRKNAGHPSGFTLVELLLAAALIPVIAFAIFANLSSGFRVWTTLNRQNVFEDVNIFYEKTSFDFYNAFHYTPLPFAGTPDKVSFACRIDAKPSLGGDRGIGEVSYFYDPAQKTVLRVERDLSQIFKDKPAQARAVLTGVISFQIAYFALDPRTRLYGWKEAWTEEEKKLPSAVTIRCEVAGLDRTGSFVRTFEIPAGGT